MRRLFGVLLVSFLMIPGLISAQQNLRSGYFLDGYTYKYKTNPAMATERGFISMPVLGNVSLGFESNLGLSTFIYPTEDGGLTTFLSPRVSHETFMDNIADRNKMNMNVDLGLVAVGFYTGKSFHTLDFSMRFDSGLNIPRGFFKFMKTGSVLEETKWDISNIGIRATARMELAYGYSRSIGESLRVGARAKLLFGVARADIQMDRMTLEMNAERWAVEAHGKMHMSTPMAFNTKGENGTSTSDSDVNAIDWSGVNAGGLANGFLSPSLGFAVDLGATYDFLDYFTASLSVLDLGMMSWKNSVLSETPETVWQFEGFEYLDSQKFNEQLNTLGKDMMNAFNFQVKESEIKKATPLAATINAAIEARMPFYERLSFGLLYTQRIEGVYSWSEGRLAATVSPVNWFSVTTNYAISNFGHSWGGALNIHLPGFGLYVGMDSFGPIMNVTPQFIPVNHLNTNLSFGINFSFGKYRGRFQKEK